MEILSHGQPGNQLRGQVDNEQNTWPMNYSAMLDLADASSTAAAGLCEM